VGNSDWLPGEPPESGAGKYFRLKDLKQYPNRSADFRIMEPFKHGWEVWVKDGKPVRAFKREDLPPQSEWRVETFNGKDKQDKPHKFWVTTLYNVAEKQFQVFEFTQGTIYNQLDALLKNKRWGAFNAYDITISSKGEGLTTEYTITPNPKEPLPEDAKAAWEKLSGEWTGLVAIFSGGDPFAPFGSDVPF